MKIVVLDGYSMNMNDEIWCGLKALGEFRYYDDTSADQLVERIGDAEIVVSTRMPMTKEVIDACPNLKMITLFATGYNSVDIEHAKKKGIPVCNVPSYSTDSVAQHVFAMMLEVCNNVKAISDEVKKGEWKSLETTCYSDMRLTEIAGKTLGVIGYGEIGQKVAKIGEAFGMRVLCYSPSDKSYLDTPNIKCDTVDNIYKWADFITLHCPFNETTKGLINKESIAKMKDGVVIINTARGGIINEKDLAEALQSGKVAYSCHDVMGVEPALDGNLLIEQPNTLVTPHIAWAPKEARIRLMDATVRNVKMFILGSPQNVVNK